MMNGVTLVVVDEPLDTSGASGDFWESKAYKMKDPLGRQLPCGTGRSRGRSLILGISMGSKRCPIVHQWRRWMVP